jgi:CheY-like chemotaxis protein
MKKILIVEDDSGVIDMLSLLLSQQGFEIIIAKNGQEGLSQAIRKHPDLIISDVLMPIMDGFHMFKELKKNNLTVSIPILVLTARGQMEDTFKALGVDGFIEKPSGSSLLIEKINELIAKPIKIKTSKRVLVGGSNTNVIKNIFEQLKNAGLEADYVLTGPDIISQSVLFNPDIIIMEVQMEADRSSSDIISAIRLLPRFKSIPVLVYSYYDVAELGVYEFHQKAVMINQHQLRCCRAGATRYVGRYEETHFLESIIEYLH